MQTFNDLSKFNKAILENKPARLVTNDLIAEAMQPKRGNAQFCVHYWQFTGLRWEKFSTFISDCAKEVVNDVRAECGCFFVSN